MAKHLHVALVLGSHVPGAERAMEHVIKRESPRGVLVENFGTKREREADLRGLGLMPGGHINSPNTAVAFVSRMLILARKHSLPFDFSETHDEDYVERHRRQFLEVERLQDQANIDAIKGDIEKAISAHHKSSDLMREFDESREVVIADHHIDFSKRYGKIVSFMGGQHGGLIKHLRERGARVTVYQVNDILPKWGNSQNTAQRKNSRRQAINGLFFHHLLNYLTSRYGITERHIPIIPQIVPTLDKLAKVPTKKFEDFYHGLKGTKEGEFPERFREFIETNGVKLPTREEVIARAKLAHYPIPKRVATLEPIVRKK